MLTTVAKLSAPVACALIIMASPEARAQTHTLEGKVMFVGTMDEYVAGPEDYQAVIRVLVHGKCTPDVPPLGGQQVFDYWVHIRSGKMQPPWSHNGPNLINAYNTFLTALTTKKNIRIDGLTICGSLPGGVLDKQNLYGLYVGIAQ